MTRIDSPPAPFVFDRDYDNREQVRHLMPEYRDRRRELDAAGRFAYNAEFLNLPGLASSADRDKDAAIYLLHGLFTLDEEAERETAFLADGGRIVDPAEFDADPALLLRGTIVHRNFYVGGTGWTEYKQARLGRHKLSYYVLPKGKRSNGHTLGAGARLLIREDGSR